MIFNSPSNQHNFKINQICCSGLRSCQLAPASARDGNLSTYDYDYVFSKRRNILSTETVENLV